MVALAALAEEGKLRPRIGATLPLSQAGKAHQLGENGEVFGKIVLRTSRTFTQHRPGR